MSLISLTGTHNSHYMRVMQSTFMMQWRMHKHDCIDDLVQAWKLEEKAGTSGVEREKKHRLSKMPTKSGAGNSSSPTSLPHLLKKHRVSMELVPGDAIEHNYTPQAHQHDRQQWICTGGQTICSGEVPEHSCQ
ncbi:hypothetical protein B0H10DRAFT_1956742 [Mycena sp. CBHHK59/15]|nr:hypothetical protein B0H10DRAFT_1956742 [Mycena sp. CBHHK59/15]